ncbi:hypothetical protein [Lacisediminihabitans sp.]|uniref:hypothetical protein n=1 Tax=Lacisediminihabitans sp. TaxID=2787631 RepID=UPI002F924EA9
MSNFVLAFRSKPDVMATEEEISDWNAWFQQLGGSVVDMGNRIGEVKLLGEGAGANQISGYSVIDASDFSGAVEIAKGCPGLKYGGSVEVGQPIAM